MSLHVNKIAQMLIKQINIWETQLYIVAFIVAFKKKKNRFCYKETCFPLLLLLFSNSQLCFIMIVS